MTPEEIKHAIDNNLQSLADVVLTLEPKVKVAEGLIKETIKGLAQYPFILKPGLSLDVDVSGIHHDLKVYWDGDDVRLQLRGEDWVDLSPRDRLLLADMLPSITAFIAIDTSKVTNEFPKISKPAEPEIIDLPQDELQQKPKRRWYHRFGGP